MLFELGSVNMYSHSEVNYLVGLMEPDISHVTFVFCATKVVQNMKITWDIPICRVSCLVFPMLFSYSGLYSSTKMTSIIALHT